MTMLWTVCLRHVQQLCSDCLLDSNIVSVLIICFQRNFAAEMLDGEAHKQHRKDEHLQRHRGDTIGLVRDYPPPGAVSGTCLPYYGTDYCNSAQTNFMQRSLDLQRGKLKTICPLGALIQPEE
jgi:hypothetical protein